MKRLSLLSLLAAACLSLGGCAASIAASAVGAAVQASQKPETVPSQDPGPAARQSCTARAEAEGKVRIIDIEYRSASRLIVWGTVEKAGQRRSFECRYEGKIVDFKLRTI